jgi:hypothetical protein
MGGNVGRYSVLELSRLPRIDWSPFAITGNKMPPRDPDEDEEDEEEDRADEPPVVREPDED